MSLKQADLISISEASRMLGVSEATLRQWTDEGRLDAFITPGGHRRYSKSELKKFTHSSQKPVSIKELAGQIEETTPRHREIGRMSIEHSPESSRPSAEQQQQLAALGRRLLGLITSYVSEPARRDEALSQARETGGSFGILLAGMGMPLTKAVQAFLMHREPILQAAAGLMARRESRSGRITESITLANRFMDETLVCMIAAHQQHCSQAAGKEPA
jgi:excisionase family DNA binding protein